MLSQFLDVLKAIGRKNRISAIYILIVSLIIVLLELITFTLIIPVISIPLNNNDFINNNPIFIYANKLTSFELSSFLTLNNVLVLLVIIIAFKYEPTLHLILSITIIQSTFKIMSP